ncbi:MAG: PLDc N-terminal domain-containing protein [Phycisphaerae bacterium]|nr:PLDc N-terminal domain-containing protein [Phycisphaerae bacterium]
MLYTAFSIVLLILNIVAVYQVVTSGKSLGTKVAWVLVIFLLPLVGLLLYYILGR